MERLPKPTGTALIPATGRAVAPYAPKPIRLVSPRMQALVNSSPLMERALMKAGVVGPRVTPEEVKERGICVPTTGEGDAECEGCWMLWMAIAVALVAGFYFGSVG
jgi:hypothetical protein